MGRVEAVSPNRLCRRLLGVPGGVDAGGQRPQWQNVVAMLVPRAEPVQRAGVGGDLAKDDSRNGQEENP